MRSSSLATTGQAGRDGATLHTPILIEDEIARFQTDGYLVVRAGFDQGEMRHIDAWAREVEAMPEVSGRQWVYHEASLIEPDRQLIARIENIAPFHAGFAELSDVLKGAVGQLLGEEAVLFKEKINFKMPGGAGFKPHQDAQAGWDAYADYFINVLVCIDAATPENGCLKVVAGQHKRGLFRSWEPLTEADMQGMEFVDCPTEPGDLVFFDSFAPHASDPNMTNATRRLYYATYNRASAGDHMARYYVDKHKNYPPDIDRQAGREYRFRV
ncbi:MAG: phytanoyl-CoA dioxygenase family protein [Rhodospirillales bacterium]|nr:phytanoyl-CoA dioxygenase family protein [Rhodospirillales bacterium]